MAKTPAPEAFELPPGKAWLALFWLLLAALATTALLMALPNNAYYRWQQGDGTILFRVRYIYERTHFDKTPIDVAMVGSSRMEASVRADEVGAGLSARLGRPIHVVNFGLPQEGRDIQLAVVKQLLEARSDVKLIVLILGPEQVAGHPGFRFIADDQSILNSPAIYNPEYAKNILTLPYRHLAYYVQGLWPSAFRLSTRFDPAIYRTINFDPTRPFQRPNGPFIDRGAHISPRDMSRPPFAEPPGVYVDPKLRFFNLDQRYAIERHSVREIARLAKAKGVDIAFFVMPVYNGVEQIFEDPVFYERIGPIMSAYFLVTDPANFMDGGHLNRTGTAKLTPWLVDQMTPIVRAAEEGR